MLFTILFSSITESLAATRRYRLSLRDDPSSSVVIGWDQNGGSGAMVYYGTTDFGQNWASYPLSHGVDRSVSANGMNNTFSRLTGLSPNTAYYFVIVDSDGVSPRFWFKTTPMGNSEPISVLAGGDSRAYLDNSPREAANLMVSKLRPDLVMFGGDYTWLNTGLEWGTWMDDWQLTTTSDGKMVATVWERGNHELSAGTVIDMFDIPGTDEYFALSVGGNFLRIYTLNTEVSVAGNQSTWLENDLIANANNHDWSIAQYHTCMRPHTSEKSNGDAHYNAWAQLFYDYGVQLVVESDAHDVKTTWPVKPSTGPNSEDGFELDTLRGSVYIGEGCWGAPLRTNDWDKYWTRNSGSFNSFHWLKIGKDTIEIRTVATDNAASVGSVSDNDKFTPPSGINIWNPSNGNVVYIVNHKTIDRPNIDVTYPFHQQFFSQPQNVTITADASSMSSSVQEVKFYVNDVYLGSDLSSPYEFNWTIPNNGQYVITAWAIDAEGWHNVSDEVKVYAGEIEITVPLSSNNDDAEENKDDGSVDLTSSDIEIIVEQLTWPIPDNNQWCGFRFSGVEIPQGANVIEAYIQFTADENQSGTSDVIIKGENVDNSVGFASIDYNISSRTLTQSDVNWIAAPWSNNSSGINERTPDISNIVTEITSRPGWQIGNAMTFILEGSGTRSAYSRDEDASKSAKLFLKYTHNTTVSINENIDNTSENKITIYPNPAKDFVNVVLENDNKYQLQIFNLEGKMVYNKTDLQGETRINLSEHNISTGVYILKSIT